MKDETRTWLSYADENLDVAGLALDHGHLNASLQNAHQAVEKYLKALITERGIDFRRTHSIRELVGMLEDQNITVGISEDEMDLMDSIYIPSKYPVYSALPYITPDISTCHDALEIAHSVSNLISDILHVEEL